MSWFDRVLSLDSATATAQGLLDTPREIAQQPEVWLETVDNVTTQQAEIVELLSAAGIGSNDLTVYLCGAGSSEYIGWSVLPWLRRRWAAEIAVMPTTDVVAAPNGWFRPERRYLMISFARSGNSPESLASFELANKLSCTCRHLIVTCNSSGTLAKAGQAHPHALVVLLPPRTHDRSLVMTSSFSSMCAAMLTIRSMEDTTAVRNYVAATGRVVRRFFAEFSDTLLTAADRPWKRVQFLGSDALHGIAREARLKCLEMTAGRVASNVDTFLGLRHGPQVFVDADALVVAFLSSDSNTYFFERDLLHELACKGQGRQYIVVCNQKPADLNLPADRTLILAWEEFGAVLHCESRILADITVAQMLGLILSVHCGCLPDNPSADGTINRVVPGFTIHSLR